MKMSLVTPKSKLSEVAEEGVESGVAAGQEAAERRWAEVPAVPFARCLSLCGVPLSVSGLEPKWKVASAFLCESTSEVKRGFVRGSGRQGFRRVPVPLRAGNRADPLLPKRAVGTLLKESRRSSINRPSGVL